MKEQQPVENHSAEPVCGEPHAPVPDDGRDLSGARVNVYVDGFNLYYGCLHKNAQYRWLDLGALCQKLLPQNPINRIRYFTARISARPDDPDAPVRQDAYLRALATVAGLSIHYGHFQETVVRMPLAYPVPGQPKIVEVLKTEEKSSDVQLASHLLCDAFRHDCDIAVVVSNDSDLEQPIRMVIELGLPVGLVNPHPAKLRSRDLLSLRPLFFKQIRPNALRASQFPAVLADERGEIHRPSKW